MARKNRFQIAHTRLTPKAVAFNDLESGGSWMDEFKPYGSEMIFERDHPSCYSSDAFAKMMQNSGSGESVLAGIGGSTSCLATLIDAHCRAHRMRYIFDASCSTAASMPHIVHSAASQLAEQFGDVLSTSILFRILGEEAPDPMITGSMFCDGAASMDRYR